MRAGWAEGFGLDVHVEHSLVAFLCGSLAILSSRVCSSGRGPEPGTIRRKGARIGHRWPGESFRADDMVPGRGELWLHPHPANR